MDIITACMSSCFSKIILSMVARPRRMTVCAETIHLFRSPAPVHTACGRSFLQRTGAVTLPRSAGISLVSRPD